MTKNNIYHDDCLNFLQKCKSEMYNCILTDPPYLYLKSQKLEREFDEQMFFTQCWRVLKSGGFIVIFGRGKSFYRWCTILTEMGFHFKEEIIWDKMQPSSPMNSIMRIHETIAIFSKGKATVNKVKIGIDEAYKFEPHKISELVYRLSTTFGNRKTFQLLKDYYEKGIYEHNEGMERRFNATLQTDIKKTNRTLQYAIKLEKGATERSIIKQPREHFTAIHPTQKPVKLLQRLLNLTTKPGDLVLDPFSGSGSTTEACIELGLNSDAVEIDDEYYTNSINRIHPLIEARIQRLF